MRRSQKTQVAGWAILALIGLCVATTCWARDPIGGASWDIGPCNQGPGLCFADADYCWPILCTNRTTDPAPFTCGSSVGSSNRRVAEKPTGTCSGDTGGCITCSQFDCAQVQVYVGANCRLGDELCTLFIWRTSACDPTGS